MNSADKQPCPSCAAEIAVDAGLCSACGTLLGRPRPTTPAQERQVPLPEGVYRFAGPLLALADYLARVVDAEQVYDRRSGRWAAVTGLAVVTAIGLGVLGYLKDWPYWWAAPLVCAAVALFSFTRFGAVSDFDLPENRLACAVALLRGLHQRGQVRGDLTLDLQHELKAELLEGSDPVSLELKVGAAAHAGSRRAQRQCWLLLQAACEGGAQAQIAITDYHEMTEQPRSGNTKGPVTRRRYTTLQLFISGGATVRRDPAALGGDGGIELWLPRVTGDATCWTRRSPPHEEVTTFDSQGRSRSRVVVQGKQPDAETAATLLAALDRTLFAS